MYDENWADLKGFEGAYQVSDQGNVRSVERAIHHKDGKITRHKQRVLKQSTNKRGYKVVYPTKASQKTSILVHRAVCEAFWPNLLELPEVNHKDEDKTNNNFDNLEWCDTAYNVDYSQSHSCKLISPEGEVVEVTNYSKFSRENGLSNGKISMLVNGTRKSHKGWTLHGNATN